jgi:hypothetical protein
MSLLLRLTTVAVLTSVLAVFASTALAGNPNGITLTAPKTVSVNYTHCTDPSGNPLPCLSPDFSVSNYSGADATCDTAVYGVINGHSSLIIDIQLGTIAQGTTAAGGLTTPTRVSNH